MKPKNFVGLHAHANSSIFDGLGFPQEHIDFVLSNGGDALALTDHGNMNGYAYAYLHTKKLLKEGKNFKFIGGVEAYYHPNLDQWRKDYEDFKQAKAELKKVKQESKDDETMTVENEDESKDTSKWFNPINRRRHLVLLPKSRKGLENIFAMVSLSHKDNFYKFPRIDNKLLKLYSEDVIALTACIAGPISYSLFYEFRDIDKNNLNAALLNDQNYLEKAVNVVGNVYDELINALGNNNVFPEIQFNKLSQQHFVNRAILEFAKRNNIKIVATCDSHYARPEYWRDREMYKKLGWLGHDNITPESLPKSKDDLKCELYPKNAEQIWDSYKNYCSDYEFYDDHQVSEAIENSWHIAHDLIGDCEPDVSIKLPSYVVPEEFKDKQFNALLKHAKEGLKRIKKDNDEVYINRLKNELSVIKDRGFELYFLTMGAIFNIASDVCLLGPGRGSAAGGLINYLLGITQIDPIKFGLIFERFLTRQRIELPDIDSDLSDRDLVINAMRERFGEENVIPITNINTLQLKSLTKDLAKFYGVDYQEVNEAVSSVEQDVRKATTKAGDDKNLFVLTFEDALEHSPKYSNFLKKYPQIHEHIKVLYKQARSIGRHAGGVLIAENLINKMPLITVKGELQTPWVEGVNVKHLNEFGFAKFDLLGLETLRVIELCIQNILKKQNKQNTITFNEVKQWFNNNLHPDVLNLDDQKVYENVYWKGNFCYTFQFTSPGAQKFIQQFKPTSILDIAVATSIYRPGPLAAKVDQLYLNAKEDINSVKKDMHPNVWEALKDTKGLIIFQESLMALATDVAGFSPEDSERVRKTILKQSISAKGSNKEKRDQIRKEFVDGCINHSKLSKIQSEELFDHIEWFCAYGFNRTLQLFEYVNIFTKDSKFIESKMIKDVIPGDYLMSRDEKTKKDFVTPVIAKHDHGVLELVELELVTGEKIKCTMDHKFRVEETGEMLPLWMIQKLNLSIVVNDAIKSLNVKKIF